MELILVNKKSLNNTLNIVLNNFNLLDNEINEIVEDTLQAINKGENNEK